jgi:nucleotide-binding universal stress UspA family protein
MSMVEIRRILCPTDFSDFSRHALEHALAIAALHHSTITLLHVCPIASGTVYAPGIGVAPTSLLTVEDRDAALATMRQFAETEFSPAASIQFAVAEGDPVNEILDCARTQASDLVVMGTHGRSGFERLLLGSVTEKVLRKAPCPVLTVPRRAAGVASALRLEHIICPVDFSDSSVQALQYAIALANESAGRLTVVHVIEIPPELPIEEHETIFSLPRSLRQYVAMAEADRNGRLKEMVANAGCRADSTATVLASGKAYQEILRIAAEQSADLIVIGVHGRGAVDLFFLGSTTQHVVRQATCPVLTIRSH